MNKQAIVMSYSWCSVLLRYVRKYQLTVLSDPVCHSLTLFSVFDVQGEFGPPGFSGPIGLSGVGIQGEKVSV